MKRLVLAGLGLVFTTSLQAGVMYGISSTKLGNGDSQYGFEMDYRYVFYQPEKLQGLGIGAYGGMDYFTIDDMHSLDDDAGMLVNVGLLTSYAFKRADIYAGVGYGAGKIGEAGYKGLNYQVGTTFHINEKHGVGIKYKHNKVDLDLEGDSSDKLDIFTLYWEYTPNSK